MPLAKVSWAMYPEPQRHVEVAAQVPMKAFDFAFGLGAIWTTKAWDESITLGKIEKSGLPAVMSLCIRITRIDNGLGVVVQNLPRNSSPSISDFASAGRKQPRSGRSAECV